MNPPVNKRKQNHWYSNTTTTSPYLARGCLIAYSARLGYRPSSDHTQRSRATGSKIMFFQLICPHRPPPTIFYEDRYLWAAKKDIFSFPGILWIATLSKHASLPLTSRSRLARAHAPEHKLKHPAENKFTDGKAWGYHTTTGRILHCIVTE